MQTLRAIEARETSGMWGPSECQIWREVDEGWLTRRRTGPCALLPAVEPLLVVVVVVHGRVRKKEKKEGFFVLRLETRPPPHQSDNLPFPLLRLPPWPLGVDLGRR